MTPEEIRELYDFNGWANQRVFDSCAALTPEQFAKPVLSSYPSAHETLAHIVCGEWIWFELWQGRTRSAVDRQAYVANLSDLASIRSAWLTLEVDRKTFLGALTAADIERVVSYRNLRGNRFAYSLRRMLQHVVNHSTYHRGLVITLLRQVGAATCATDYLRYFDWRAGDRED